MEYIDHGCKVSTMLYALLSSKMKIKSQSIVLTVSVSYANYEASRKYESRADFIWPRDRFYRTPCAMSRTNSFRDHCGHLERNPLPFGESSRLSRVTKLRAIPARFLIGHRSTLWCNEIRATYNRSSYIIDDLIRHSNPRYG